MSSNSGDEKNGNPHQQSAGQHNDAHESEKSDTSVPEVATGPITNQPQQADSSQTNQIMDAPPVSLQQTSDRTTTYLTSANGQSRFLLNNSPFTVVAITPNTLTLVATNNQNDTVTITASSHQSGRTCTSNIASRGHRSRDINQKRPSLREGQETIGEHPTDSTKLIARFRIQDPSDPSGRWMDQVDVIPILNQEAEASDGDVESYFEPDPEKAKVPPKARANRSNARVPPSWIQQPDGSWTRSMEDGESTEVWRPTIIFRRFNKSNNSYEEGYISSARLSNINPNDQAWYYPYNKWIDQFRRRRDSNYKKMMNKDHWTIAERRELMNSINEFVQQFGLHNFGTGKDVSMGTTDFQKMTDAVNSVGKKNRHIDAVRGQIFSSHQRKNKVIDDLIKHTKNIRSQLANEKVFTKSELFPQEAIQRHLWPTESSLELARVRKTAGGRRKGKYDDLVATFEEGGESDAAEGDDTICETQQDKRMEGDGWYEEGSPGEGDEWTTTDEEIEEEESGQQESKVSESIDEPSSKKRKRSLDTVEGLPIKKSNSLATLNNDQDAHQNHPSNNDSREVATLRHGEQERRESLGPVTIHVSFDDSAGNVDTEMKDVEDEVPVRKVSPASFSRRNA